MVVTEPVPDVIEELGWTGGEPIADGRTLLHYLRTTRDGRIAFGWGGGRMGFGARRGGQLEVDPDGPHARPATTCFASSRSSRVGRITHAWGGPIDVSPTHLPIFGSRGRSPPRLRLHQGTASARPTSVVRSSRVSRSTAATS